MENAITFSENENAVEYSSFKLDSHYRFAYVPLLIQLHIIPVFYFMSNALISVRPRS